MIEYVWEKMETAPRDGTPILLLSPDGYRGIGFSDAREYDGLRFFAGHIAWIGIREGETRTGVWIGGHSFDECVGWRQIP